MTINKRQKEKLRQERQKEKEEKRMQRKVDKDRRPAAEGDIDPDIAGIIPGPQPILEEDE